jgi:hypothetical protein
MLAKCYRPGELLLTSSNSLAAVVFTIFERKEYEELQKFSFCDDSVIAAAANTHDGK